MENKIIQALQAQQGKAFGSPSPVGSWLAGTLIQASHGNLTVAYTVRPDFLNPAGVMHGGIYATMLDDTLGAAVYALGGEYMFTTLNLNIDYLAAAKLGDTVTITAHIIRAGKNIVHCEARLTNNDGKLLAKATSNLAKTHIPSGLGSNP
jgi:acyl-coenzyme A thioesterase 13